MIAYLKVIEEFDNDLYNYIPNETFFMIHETYVPYFGIQNVSEYGIFWNMKYFEIWNILENAIFLNMEYLKNDKVKQNILL